MSEDVKKHRPPPDPNSAKYKLGQIAAKAYSDAQEAKERGEMVGWCSSNFPVEIPETLGLAVVYPENQAAGIAARGGGTRLCLRQDQGCSGAEHAPAGFSALLQQHLQLHDQMVREPLQRAAHSSDHDRYPVQPRL